VTDLLGLAVGGLCAVVALRVLYAAREAEGRRTFAVTYPRGGAPDQVLAFARSLSGLLPPWWRRIVGSPAVVIESAADRSGIRHYLRLPAGSAEYVTGQLRAALPGVRIVEADPPPFRPRLALELRTSSRTQPLRTDDPAQSAAAILASLQPLGNGERVVIQWIVTPAPAASVPDVVTLRDQPLGLAALFGSREPVRVPAELVAGARDKRSEPALFAVLRIGVATASRRRDRQVLRRVLGSFHLGTSPWASFRRRWLPAELVAGRISRARAAVFGWPCLVNAKEAAAFLGVPIGEPRLPGLTLGASPQLPPAAEIPRTGRVLGRATFPGAERPVAVSAADSLMNTFVTGPTGVGKSTVALGLICGDLAAGHGVVVVDPKGDLVTDLLDRVPPKRMRDVILLDPTDTERPVGFNLLNGAADAPELMADQVVALFRGLYAAFWGPRTDDILRAALLTLARQPGMTLAEIPVLLAGDERFRRRLTATLDDHVLEGFWGWYESLSAGERAQAIGPVLNKVRTFLLRRRLRNVIGQSQSTFSLADVLAERKVLLVNLAKGTLGEDAARLLGAAILAQLWQAVQARAALPAVERHPVFGFVDEFQDFLGNPTTTSFSDFLAQTRGYGFGITLITQSISASLPRDLRIAVLANARTRIAFQLAHADAALFAKEFGPDVSADDLGALGAFEAVAQVAAKSQVSRPVSIATLPPPPSLGSARAVRALSRQRYGRPVEDVERELRARTERVPDAPIKRTRRAS
jgi:hypothetical protein